MSNEADRTLDFAGALAELQAFVGTRVSVESGPEAAGAFHESRGILARSIDLQLQSGWPLDRPARVAFFLDGADAQFVVRETGFVIGLGYTVRLAEGPSRAVQMHYAGGAVLIVREQLD